MYDPGRTLAARPATDAELERTWPPPWRAVERGEGGSLLSFFTSGDEHVVTRAKEVGTLRPHGTILRTGATALPDPGSLTVTSWMTGSPLSYLTRGHASNRRLLTTVRGYLGLHREYGVRVLVEVADRWRLLDLPSAFSNTPDGARWMYFVDPDGPDAGGVVEVRTTAPPTEHVLRLSVQVTSGRERRVMLALHCATGEDPLPAPPGAVTVRERPDGVVVAMPAATLALRSATALTLGDDGPLFDDGLGRGTCTVTLRTEPRPGARRRAHRRPRGRPRRGELTERSPRGKDAGGSRTWPATGGRRSPPCAWAPSRRPSRWR